MKTIMVIIDGAENKDYKLCKNINDFKYSININNTPKGMEANSLTCIMNLLGVPSIYIPEGRAYLEALSVGENIEDDDLVLRCNNVDIIDEILISSCSTNRKRINKIGEDFKLIHMGSYKNLLIIRNGYKDFESLVTYPPHQNLGKNINKLLPKCNNKQLEIFLRDLILKYNIYPWGQSKKNILPSFYELHKLKGAVICKTEIVKGIAAVMDMYTQDVIGATADVDTNLKNKTLMALEAIKDNDFVLLHINGADESAHRRNQKEKEEFINKIDNQVVKYLKENIDEKTNLIITSDHETSSESGKHINSFVKLYTLSNDKEDLLWLRQ